MIRGLGGQRVWGALAAIGVLAAALIATLEPATGETTGHTPLTFQPPVPPAVADDEGGALPDHEPALPLFEVEDRAHLFGSWIDVTPPPGWSRAAADRLDELRYTAASRARTDGLVGEVRVTALDDPQVSRLVTSEGPAADRAALVAALTAVLQATLEQRLRAFAPATYDIASPTTLAAALEPQDAVAVHVRATRREDGGSPGSGAAGSGAVPTQLALVAIARAAGPLLIEAREGNASVAEWLAAGRFADTQTVANARGLVMLDGQGSVVPVPNGMRVRSIAPGMVALGGPGAGAQIRLWRSWSGRSLDDAISFAQRALERPFGLSRTGGQPFAASSTDAAHTFSGWLGRYGSASRSGTPSPGTPSDAALWVLADVATGRWMTVTYAVVAHASPPPGTTPGAQAGPASIDVGAFVRTRFAPGLRIAHLPDAPPVGIDAAAQLVLSLVPDGRQFRLRFHFEDAAGEPLAFLGEPYVVRWWLLPPADDGGDDEQEGPAAVPLVRSPPLYGQDSDDGLSPVLEPAMRLNPSLWRDLDKEGDDGSSHASGRLWVHLEVATPTRTWHTRARLRELRGY